MSLSFPNNPKHLGQSYKAELDFWDKTFQDNPKHLGQSYNLLAEFHKIDFTYLGQLWNFEHEG